MAIGVENLLEVLRFYISDLQKEEVTEVLDRVTRYYKQGQNHL